MECRNLNTADETEKFCATSDNYLQAALKQTRAHVFRLRPFKQNIMNYVSYVMYL